MEIKRISKFHNDFGPNPNTYPDENGNTVFIVSGEDARAEKICLEENLEEMGYKVISWSRSSTCDGYRFEVHTNLPWKML